MANLILAIDPGREKCGLAVVDRREGLKHKEIIPTDKLQPVVEVLVDKYNITQLVIGDRTTSREAQKLLSVVTAKQGGKVAIALVNEHRSTDEARGLYWRAHPPKGFKRLIPLGLQAPPCPVDDYVALLLAQRYFGGQEDSE